MSLQERLEIIRSSPIPRGEEQAKYQIIAPILHNLGWDPSEVLLEYSAGGKQRGGRIDMALMASGRIVALIEAKAPRSNLHDHVDQVIGYAHHEGVDVCVLTTGLEWWLYLPRERGRPPKRRFAVLQLIEGPLEELAADLATFLGRESLINGQAEELAKVRLEHVRLNSEVPTIWEQMLREPDAELVGLVQRRVHDRAHLRLTNEQVAAALQGSPIPSAESPVTPPPDLPEGTPGRSPTVKPTAIELWGKRIPIRNHFEIVLAVAEGLHERHPADFHRICEIEGRKNAYVARSPEGMRASRPIGRSGYFVNIHASGKALENRARKFLYHFGYSPESLSVLFD